MSERRAKYTRGKWRPKKKRGVFHVHANFNGITLHIARTSETGKDGEREANATLIAAAPELFERLRTLLYVNCNGCRELASTGQCFTQCALAKTRSFVERLESEVTE